MPHLRFCKGFSGLNEQLEHDSGGRSYSNGKYASRHNNFDRFRRDFEDEARYNNNQQRQEYSMPPPNVEHTNGIANGVRKTFKAPATFTTVEEWDAELEECSPSGDEPRSKRTNHSSGASGKTSQFALPRGCKIGKGFGCTAKNRDAERELQPFEDKFAGAFRDERAFDYGDDHQSRSKPYYYGRSKSTLEDEKQEQDDYGGDRRRHSNYDYPAAPQPIPHPFPNPDSARFGRILGRRSSYHSDTTTTTTTTTTEDEELQQRPPVEGAFLRKGFGRGRPVAMPGGQENGEMLPQRPAGLAVAQQHYTANRSIDYHDHHHQIDDTNGGHHRFTIAKASSLFGARPQVEGGNLNGGGDWDRNGHSDDQRRKFMVAKPGDVFRNPEPPSEREIMESERQESEEVRRRMSRLRDLRGGGGSGSGGNSGGYGRTNSRNNNNRSQYVAPRFVAKQRQEREQLQLAAEATRKSSSSRSPSLTDRENGRKNEKEQKHLPWPYSRFCSTDEVAAGRNSDEDAANRKASPLITDNGDDHEIQLSDQQVGAAAVIGDNGRIISPPQSELLTAQQQQLRTLSNGEANGGKSPSPPTTTNKPSVLSIYEQYENFDFENDNDDFNKYFLKPADQQQQQRVIAPPDSTNYYWPTTAASNFNDVQARFSDLGITSQSPAFSSSSQKSSPFSWSIAP